MSSGSAGEYAALMRGWLSDIMYGVDEHPWAFVVKESDDIGGK